MQVFYAPDIKGDTYVLDDKESRHVVKAMRMKKGSAVHLIDGMGNLYNGEIAEPDPKACVISIKSIIKEFEKRDYSLHIAISPLKNADRFEWFIEKSVEMGIDEITPLICTNTEHQSIRKERLNNIIVSAMKQSLKAKLTKLNDPIKFSEFISSEQNGTRMIAHCKTGLHRDKIAGVYRAKNDAVILIGPEGDFTEAEIEEAFERGFTGIHLGPARLRTETAGIAACHSVYIINQ
ncbi:MAG TPA: 16S rRNA (uracil(1498)-N(3))-methyltransferase [Bacteroidales bacterium]|nr:16S rRNA (uracil(1498)-N(3))-methyltransferase [Bacteroidales bacterium]